MRDGDSGVEAGQSGAEGARGIALYDEQIRTISEQREQRGRDDADMPVRVRLAGAVEAHCRKAAKTELLGPQQRVLTGEHERRPAAASGQPLCDRTHFDCFRPGADHQPDIGETQYSP
jgi:hypothetical protein